MNKNYAFLAVLVLAQTPLLSFAKPHSSQEVYSATVDDGTAHEIGSHCNIETNCAVSSKKMPLMGPPKPVMNARKELKRLPPVVVNKPKVIIPVVAAAAPAMPAVKPAASDATPASALQLSPTSEPDVLDPHFDTVPKEKVAEISERMIYSYEILKRFGRAYDYRATKLSELKRILKDLERTNQTAKN